MAMPLCFQFEYIVDVKALWKTAGSSASLEMTINSES
jgi:hypothetical protein